MKILKICAVLWAVVCCGCTADDDSQRHFDNKAYINTGTTEQQILFKPSEEAVCVSRSLSIGMPIPEGHDVTAKFVYDPELVEKYKVKHGTDALPLPAEMVSIPTPELKILRGSTKSSETEIVFTGIEALDKEKLYVVPVSLTDVQGVDVLKSKTVVYYVFRGAALINVVADIARNKFPVKWNTDMTRVKTITFEVFLRARSFGAAYKDKSFISTIFGAENAFLVRFGDIGFHDNQLQCACPYGNFPTKDKNLGIQTDEWVHIAVIWDAVTGDRALFYNGKEMARDKGVYDYAWSDLSYECHVGFSYEDNRWFDGEVCEMRVWNKQRTAKEIAENMYELDPDTEGLVAYWKFNEGAGNLIKDHSGNGNDITAENDLKWTSVSINKPSN